MDDYKSYLHVYGCSGGIVKCYKAMLWYNVILSEFG